jgi:hypothetical protein
MNRLPEGLKTFSSFLAGFLAFSFIFTAFARLTVGAKMCELSRSIQSSNISATVSPEACQGIVEAWISSITGNPFYNPFFWSLSLAAGLFAAVTYLLASREG